MNFQRSKRVILFGNVDFVIIINITDAKGQDAWLTCLYVTSLSTQGLSSSHPDTRAVAVTFLMDWRWGGPRDIKIVLETA